MIFVNKGDAPLTDAQLNKRTQKYIDLEFPEWKRERSIRNGDNEFNTYMAQVQADTDVNRANNTFNSQLAAYKQAVARLAQYVVADGQAEVTKEVVVGQEQVGTETTTGTKYLGYHEDGNAIPEEVTSE